MAFSGGQGFQTLTYMYDIIGDLHGHADELQALLAALGYRNEQGAHRHPSRQAIFVGDFVDRGPQIAETVQLVRKMVDAGTAQAVMGNHEFNAIAFHTRHPQQADKFLREHTPRNVDQHRATLEQLGENPSSPALAEALDWFRTLPVTLDLDGLRVVHACWDSQAIDLIERARAEFGGVTDDFMRHACERRTPLYLAIEDVLKGKEAQLPPGYSVRDRYGHPRTRVRTRWFEEPGGRTFREFALPMSTEMPELPLTPDAEQSSAPYGPDEPPLFFGHYWLMDDPPQPLAKNVACLDYSVARGGHLCAYRWDGESTLSPEKFVRVKARE